MEALSESNSMYVHSCNSFDPSLWLCCLLVCAEQGGYQVGYVILVLGIHIKWLYHTCCQAQGIGHLGLKAIVRDLWPANRRDTSNWLSYRIPNQVWLEDRSCVARWLHLIFCQWIKSRLCSCIEVFSDILNISESSSGIWFRFES